MTTSVAYICPKCQQNNLFHLGANKKLEDSEVKFFTCTFCYSVNSKEDWIKSSPNAQVYHELVVGKTTLDQVYLQITDNAGSYPFITFSVTVKGVLVLHNTIPFCRFRDDVEQEGLLDVRSCDCGGMECGQPTVRMYMHKVGLKNYVLKKYDRNMHYVFECAN